VDGVRRQLELRRLLGRPRGAMPGLRGGVTRVSGGRLELRDVEWARRVRVSGRLTAAGTGRLTLRGAVRGTVDVRRFKVRR
jgi:hypothetical protein